MFEGQRCLLPRKYDRLETRSQIGSQQLGRGDPACASGSPAFHLRLDSFKDCQELARPKELAAILLHQQSTAAMLESQVHIRKGPIECVDFPRGFLPLPLEKAFIHHHLDPRIDLEEFLRFLSSHSWRKKMTSVQVMPMDSISSNLPCFPTL